MEVNDELHDSAALPPGNVSLVAIGQEAGQAPESFWSLWRREEIPTPAGN
jgi:hypothetical protein